VVLAFAHEPAAVVARRLLPASEILASVIIIVAPVLPTTRATGESSFRIPIAIILTWHSCLLCSWNSLEKANSVPFARNLHEAIVMRRAGARACVTLARRRKTLAQCAASPTGGVVRIIDLRQ